ncbi:SPOSA6832_01345 [Sporobolomyces salmonicolor]|uniref:SPOSA6832_01345-mRNA-1:cds n=1 Tax=Sporidiobolus salmonicolor TaxID=5005 RepID=A0A0D6EIL1_SPOSA|nr:SPOSA6832_01345 [Sporobolomyces salmonicolor]
MSPSQLANDRFICFGDSITEWSWANNGLGAQLSHVYCRSDVLNRGLAGYNSTWALECLRKWLPLSPSGAEPKTALMTIWLGANDSVLPGEPQHVPLPTYRANLSSIVSLLRSPQSPYYDPSTSFILITPPPLSPPDWVKERVRRGLPECLDRDQDNTRRYAEEVKELGQELGVPVVDAFQAIWSKAEVEGLENLPSFFLDGLHLSAKGYACVVDEVKKVILDLYPEKSWETLPQLYPDWKSIPLGSEFAFALRAVEEKAAHSVDPF